MFRHDCVSMCEYALWEQCISVSSGSAAEVCEVHYVEECVHGAGVCVCEVHYVEVGVNGAGVCVC